MSDVTLATILMSAVRFIFHKSVSASATCAIASVASLGPVPFFLHTFWVTEEVQVYGRMRANSPWQLVVKVLILLATTIVIYVVGAYANTQSSISEPVKPIPRIGKTVFAGG